MMGQFEFCSPPWLRGGRDLKKISRSNLVGSGRGGWFKQPIIGGLNQPPRPRELRSLREIFLIAQPPLLIQGGEFPHTIVPVLSNSPLRPWPQCHNYSCRRATVGSTLTARRVGTRHANNAMSTSPIETARNVTGSVGLTCHK